MMEYQSGRDRRAKNWLLNLVDPFSSMQSDASSGIPARETERESESDRRIKSFVAREMEKGFVY
jgi:hypothetical protein